MDLERILFTQGFGSGGQCRALIADGRVSVAGSPCTNAANADTDIPSDTLASFEFQVDGATWRYREKAYLVLNKPPGYECSRDPHHHLSVFHLFPPQLPEPRVQCVSRL